MRRNAAEPAFDGTFAHAYELTIVTSVPEDVPLLDLPPTAAHDDASWLARITPRAAPAFTARVNAPHGGGYGLTGAWATPHPDVVALVQNGYGMLVDTRVPQRQRRIPGSELTGVIPVPAAHALAFVDAEQVIVVGADRIWTQVVMTSDLRILRVTGTEIVLEGCDVAGEPARRIIDLRR